MEMYKKFTAFVFILFFSDKTVSCNCLGQISLKKELKETSLAFKGSLLKVDTINVISDIGTNITLVKYTFNVARVYTGKKKKNVQVITGVGNGDCGYKFDFGKEYIVFGSKKNKYYASGEKVKKFFYSDICTRTTIFDERVEREILIVL